MDRRGFLAGLSGVVLAACSGGADDTSTDSAAPAPTSTPSETAAPTSPATTPTSTVPDPAPVDWRPVVPALAPFALGVASGDPDATSVLLWTRLIDDPLGDGPAGEVDVGWTLATDPDLVDVVASGTVTAGPDSAHRVEVLVDGLEPGRTWFYGFSTERGASMVGRTRTAPAADATRTTIAVASCQRFQDGSYVAHRHLAAADVDLVAFLGDVIYADGGGDAGDPRAFDEPRPGDLDGFRRRHARYRADPDLQACLAAHPWVVTRDDNDVANGWGPDHPLRQPAEQALAEHHPIRREADGDLRRLVRWGDLVDLALVDVRPHRSPPAGRDSRLGAVVADAAMEAEDRTMLGAEQEAWLGDALASSTARWQLVASQVMIGDLSIEVGGDRLLNNDQWDGYPAPRRRLVEQLASASAPLVVAGDLHSAVVDVLRDERGAAVATELVTPSISSRVDERIATAVNAAPIFQPDLLEVRGGVSGWVELTLGTERAEAAVVLVDPSDPGAEASVEIGLLVDRGAGEPVVRG